MFKKVILEQSSDEWLSWRSEGITATAAATIMGLNPYGNVYDLWADKTGTKSFVFVENEAATHGSNTEEKARQEFIKSTGINMKPVCVENLKYPFIRASLDGLNEEHKLGLEIKCPFHFGSFNKHKLGLLPYYYAQVQHQLLSVGDPEYKWAFWSYFKGSDSLHIVEKDDRFQEELLRRCILFYELVINKIAPDQDLFLPYEIYDQYI